MPSFPDRMAALRRFASVALADECLSIEPASADASFRSYWRITTQRLGGVPEGAMPVSQTTKSIAPHGVPTSLIVMDAPPDKENIGPWLDVGARLHGAGLHTPQVIAVDRAQGFVLMEDLGTRTYLPELNDASVDALYQDAFDALVCMQAKADVAALPSYDRALLITELELMPEWFLRRHLGFTPSCDEWDVIEAAFTFLIHAALEQPRAFVHRDFHSRNLLIVDANSPGIIDFQDAVIGPITYDLVSLLRDCYIEWEAERVDGWMERYRAQLRHAQLIGADVETARFRRWFDLTGLQRHLKVLGIFCRLWYRDGKPQYLANLPLVWRYAITIARRYPQLGEFVALLERARGERNLTEAGAGTAA